MKASTPLVLTAVERDGKAHIRIVGGIYQWQNSSREFREQIEDMQLRGIQDAHIYIKSEGGDVFEANEIANLIDGFKGKITGEGGSLVASAATYIACKLDDFTMPSNGQFMIHKPMASLFDKNEDEIASTLKLLKNITSNFIEVYARKTGLTAKKVEDLWSKGDFWMSAKEAKKKGFISGISDEEEFTSEDVTLLRACGAPNLPKEVLNITNNMKKLTITALMFLKLNENASEKEVEDTIKALKEKADQYDNLKATLEEKEKTEVEAKIKAVLDKAIADKRLTEDYRASFVAKLKGNYEAAVKEIEALKPVTQLSKEVAATTANGISAERKDWKYGDWAEKDAQGLQAMIKENPETFKALYKAEYGVEPVKEVFN